MILADRPMDRAVNLVFDQKAAQELAHEDALIFLCGHYEGVDERVIEEIVTDEFSIGDYVLTGGELPAMVMIDTISRLIPGVLGNEDSAPGDSFQNGLQLNLAAGPTFAFADVDSHAYSYYDGNIQFGKSAGFC